MSIRIRRDDCVGCGECVEACPGNLIKLDDEGLARMRRPRDCWGCTSCLKACPAGAVAFYLGADMGGTGATLGFSREGTTSHWVVTCPDARRETIDVDSANANKY